MRYAAIAVLLSITSPTLIPAKAWARDEAQVAAVAKEDIRLLGRLNVNLATREELLLIPALDAQKVDQLLEARNRGALSSLGAFALPEESLARLSVSGPSTLRRIRALPLQIFASESASANR